MAYATPLAGPILVLGCGGMLGRATTALLAERRIPFLAADMPQFNLLDRASITQVVNRNASIVINCAAYTDVDGAESNQNIARAINATGVAWLAERCRDTAAMLIHYSTDYVFDGKANSPYPTDHPKKPINAYGQSKSEGEDAILASGADHLILRTSWLYAPWAKNFVRTIARFGAEKPTLRVVNDQRGRPTSAEHLADITLRMITANARGTHHATDGGECTWFDFASAIVSDLGLPARVEPCTSDEFPRPAARPAYSTLDISRTEAMIGRLTPWRECLAAVLPRLESTP